MSDAPESRAPGVASETFGERLKRLRRTQGYTLTELAHAVGITEGAIRQLECGASKSASFAVGVRLSIALGVEPRDLVFGDGDGTEGRPHRVPVPPSRVDVLEGTITSFMHRLTALENRWTALENRVKQVERQRH